MKSYSLVGTVLAFLLALSSCNLTEPYDENDIYDTYVHLFIKEFGLIDPDHTWGFGTASKSRACNTNGGTEWVLPDAITDYEREAVRRYLNQPSEDIKKVSALQYSKYYITHVYANPHKVTSLNGTSIYTNKKMNYLVVGETPTANVIAGGESNGCVHVNDFNAALNKDYNGHMVMYDSGTYDFAYHCSVVDENYNNYIIIAGADVDTYMATQEYDGDREPSSLAKYFYVCFDFNLHPDAVTAYYNDTKYTVAGIEGVKSTNLTFPVTEENTYKTKPSEDEIKKAILAQNAELAGKTVADITLTNYADLTVTYSNGDKWVDGDGIYDDWVVRIIGNAKRLTDDNQEIGTTKTTDDTPVEEYAQRIMVEDLSVTANYEYGAASSDWDFNDLVFNATIDETGKAKIKIMALGGTLPIYIADNNGHKTKELHRYFIDREGSFTTMINTGLGDGMDPVVIPEADLADFVFDQGDYRSIKVLVEIDGVEREVEARKGLAPGKICVPVNKRWMSEYRNIKLDNPGFEDWVKDQGKNDWMYSNSN